MHSPLTKSAVARSQLATAIELFFAGRDSVSIYSLAANAWEVTDALCTRAGVESMSIQARGCLPVGKDLKRNYVNSPHRNFFKHADNDPHGLTPRSSGPPTAWRLGRAAVLFIIVRAAKAPHRWRPLNSHVRPRIEKQCTASTRLGLEASPVCAPELVFWCLASDAMPQLQAVGSVVRSLRLGVRRGCICLLRLQAQRAFRSASARFEAVAQGWRSW
jgi:hypothetical protein